jgi:hypothetical protein
MRRWAAPDDDESDDFFFICTSRSVGIIEMYPKQTHTMHSKRDHKRNIRMLHCCDLSVAYPMITCDAMCPLAAMDDDMRHHNGVPWAIKLSSDPGNRITHGTTGPYSTSL